ncbi:sigma-70 family RNA polymerase sigma factor [Nocardia puris]|uniref:RNA polymerase sigma-70 factor (ECF subfamily) n=1 Tax=Nocardia puris TaxID=208602 RepID=A0A366DHN3_9NOCA|nr:sigma-70 family RNA polymerase sigma factor [Nocardia puris]MBF6213408.1 sigma-70 family RNA polymerase sigma factor [Nocardia puris]MBF6369423.1 sigma-70 family RNA polymerase sigma factor [Nocardia puris]MBF6462288.1 sigma-70 family RNA polymerase sigma factor [Nocardia puris]RBO89597.1 RNA polymerase sigma-70 factor (ECF subfamily) [Nocardia puris]
MVTSAEFEAARPQLTALAFRFLGSLHDAEDVVQSTWIKASTTTGDLRNPAAWLTTVLTRLCLDQLRTRRRGGREPLLADDLPSEELTADEHYLRRENISRALMVVLDRLTPAQRVAYVLHDLFDIPFRDVADTLGTTPDNAKKHASRARRRIEHAEPAPAAPDSAVVDAFLAAAAGGDIDRMVALMTSDCVRTADTTLVPPGIRPVVTGARAVAEETTLFAARIRASTPMIVDGRRVHVIAPGGHLLAVIDIEIIGGLVSRIDIARASARTPIELAPKTESVSW